ncbi:atherin-like [Schistocerca cancellata]|uniref:atherin-like n=1 Tax=Schistocerca cancellata TaxID=274614 RepID=UPI0021191EB8|nr:atherin-like [Schistocerca cancellata]
MSTFSGSAVGSWSGRGARAAAEVAGQGPGGRAQRQPVPPFASRSETPPAGNAEPRSAGRGRSAEPPLPRPPASVQAKEVDAAVKEPVRVARERLKPTPVQKLDPLVGIAPGRGATCGRLRRPGSALPEVPTAVAGGQPGGEEPASQAAGPAYELRPPPPPPPPLFPAESSVTECNLQADLPQ